MDRPEVKRDFEEWKRRVRSAPDEELRALRNSAYLGLHGERWATYIAVVEEEMRHRGIED